MKEFDKNKSQGDMPRRYEHIDRVTLWIMAQRQAHAQCSKAYLAKCQEVEELKLDLKNSHSRIDTYLDQKAALQLKVTDIEVQVKTLKEEFRKKDDEYRAMLGANSILNERLKQALKEQAGEKGEREDND